jgi:hypothetical protein
MSVKLSFWIRSSQKTNQRKAPIYLRIQQGDIRTQVKINWHFFNFCCSFVAQNDEQQVNNKPMNFIYKYLMFI